MCLDDERAAGGGSLRESIAADPMVAALFFGALVYVGLAWQARSPVPAADAVVETTVALADGHLGPVEPAGERGPALGGADAGHRGVGGQAVLSLPFLVLFRTVDVVAGPGQFVALLWSVSVAGFGTAVGRLAGRPRTGTRYGAGVGLTLLVVNLAAHEPLPANRLPVVALGAATAVAAALTAPTLYVLVSRLHGRTVGAVAGAGVVLATPMGLWATVPVRHGFVALLAVLAALTLHESQRSQSATAGRLLVAAFALAGLTAWIDPVDGAAVLTGLVLAEAVGERRARPTIAGVTAALGLPVVLRAVTTLALAGSPAAGADNQSAAGPRWLFETVGGLVAFGRRVGAGVGAATDPGLVFDVFLRSSFSRTPVDYVTLGPIPLQVGGVPLDLSVLEAMPATGFLLAGIVVAYDLLRGGTTFERGCGATTAVDVFVVAAATGLVVASLPAVAGGSSVMAREFYPALVLATYLLVRLVVVREAVRHEWRLVGWTYCATLVGGGAAFLAVAVWATGIPLEVARLHAMASFTVGVVGAYWGVAGSLVDGDGRATAVLLGVSGAATTSFVLLAGAGYLEPAPYVLAVSRFLAMLLPV